VEVAPKGFDTGGIYESYGRGWLIQIPDEKENILKQGEWNTMRIRVLHLPAVYLYIFFFYKGTNKYARITIRFLFKFHGKVNYSTARTLRTGINTAQNYGM